MLRATNEVAAAVKRRYEGENEDEVAEEETTMATRYKNEGVGGGGRDYDKR